MAVTNEKSTQVSNLEAQPPVGLPTTDWKGVKRIMRFTFTQGSNAGDAGSTAELVKLPAGNIRVLTAECNMHRSAFGSGRTLNIGHRAYQEPSGPGGTGADVAEDDNAFLSALAVATAGAALWNAGTLGAGVDGLDQSAYISSREGVMVYATVAGGTIPVGATLTGYVTYIQD